MIGTLFHRCKYFVPPLGSVCFSLRYNSTVVRRVWNMGLVNIRDMIKWWKMETRLVLTEKQQQTEQMMDAGDACKPKAKPCRKSRKNRVMLNKPSANDPEPVAVIQADNMTIKTRSQARNQVHKMINRQLSKKNIQNDTINHFTYPNVCLVHYKWTEKQKWTDFN